ncbi:hypothetical protein EIP86_011405 [Pleurotus ostreatoroseus]|nr:hypothetical protein EIP86_011405 [Pleurotus ostreatoroseus]
MVVDRKRKRGQDISQRDQKRRHVSPELEEDEEQYISDDGATFDQVGGPGEDEVGSHEDEDEEDEMDSQEEEEEDDEWAGLNGANETEDAEASESRPGTKPKKPPTGEELRNIKDATDLYRSSSFKLQIDALLPNVRPKYQKAAPLDRFLLSLHPFLKSLPSVEAQHPLAASRQLLKKGIAVPYPNPLPTEDTNWKVSFEPPTEITLVGSWPTKLSVKAQDKLPYTVDLAVEMPASLFQEKDYMNGRFFHKRAYYLAVIAAAIAKKKGGLKVDVAFDSVSSDVRLTTLILRSRQGKSSILIDGSADDFSKTHAQVRILLTLLADSPIPSQRLAPHRSNIRASSSSDESTGDASTPIYNTALLTTTTPRPHLLRIYHLKQQIPAFEDALTLLRVWANQRGYGAGAKLSVRGFEGKGMFWASVLDLLISGEETSEHVIGRSASQRKPLGKGLSSYQLFRAALDFFVRHDFNEPVFIKSENGHREYDSHEAVLVDSTSTVNVLAGITLSSLELLKHDAKLTLEVLNSTSLASRSSQDPFQEVFLKDLRDLQSRFDVHDVSLDLASAKPAKLSALRVLDHGSPYNALLATLVSTLRKGLGNRVKAIGVLHNTSESRPLSQAHPSNSPIVYVGLVLDTEHAFRLVDHGPAADNPDASLAEEFRAFWGDKAELRRFKDGSIAESVVWEVKTADERAHIPYYISRHLLARHCGIQGDAVQSWQASYDALLRLPESITTLYQAAKVPTGFKAVMTAFDGLVKNIKALDDELPLAILNVSPAAESLRYTNAFSPVALPSSLSSVLPSSARFFPAMDIIIEFEKSGRWPDDLRAIQKIKLAFFEALGSTLMRSVDGLHASVVIGDGVSTSEIEDTAALELVTPEGWAFRASIWHDREATLLDQLIDDRPHVPKHIKRKMQQDESAARARERAASAEAKEVYVRRFVHAPRHHRAVAALAHRYTAYAGTVRLAKRWLAAHWLLGGHVRPEAVELVCAKLFVGDGAGGASTVGEGVPGTKERGFARFVELLKDWEWADGIFVPMSESSEGMGEADGPSASRAGRAGVWRISTEFDKEGFMWTSQGPDAVVARRIRAVAKAAWGCLQAVESEAFDVKTLFTHPTTDYDVIIQLDPSVLPRYYQNIAADPSVWRAGGKYANAALALAKTNGGEGLKPGFDPTQLFFADLSRIYADTFKIFYDSLGGDRFGLVWDPSLKEPRAFRVLGGFSSIPVAKEGDKEARNKKEKDCALVTLNVDAVLAEVERLGAGLVKSIIVQE